MFKNLFLLLALVVSAPSFADSRSLYRFDLDRTFDGADFHFETNGAAWLELRLGHDLPVEVPGGGPYGRPMPGDRHISDKVRVELTGLSFDAAASRIVFANANGSKAVCATVTEKRGFFGRKWMIQLTGECAVVAVRQGQSQTVLFQTR